MQEHATLQMGRLSNSDHFLISALSCIPTLVMTSARSLSRLQQDVFDPDARWRACSRLSVQKTVKNIA